MGKRRIANTAQERVTTKLVMPHGKNGIKKNVKNLSEKEYRAELYYRTCLQVVDALFANGLLTKREVAHVRKRLLKKYNPIISKMFEE